MSWREKLNLSAIKPGLHQQLNKHNNLTCIMATTCYVNNIPSYFSPKLLNVHEVITLPIVLTWSLCVYTCSFMNKTLIKRNRSWTWEAKNSLSSKQHKGPRFCGRVTAAAGEVMRYTPYSPDWSLIIQQDTTHFQMKKKKIYIYYHISWNLHQQISMTSKMLVRVQVLDSTHRTGSKQTTDRFCKVTFEVTNCWNVIAPECIYCQVCALQNWMVSFAPRKSVIVSNAGSNVSTIWTPHVIKTWLMLRKLLLTIYTIIQNGTWEWLIRVHALWVTFWCKLALCNAQRGGLRIHVRFI